MRYINSNTMKYILSLSFVLISIATCFGQPGAEPDIVAPTLLLTALLLVTVAIVLWTVVRAGKVLKNATSSSPEERIVQVRHDELDAREIAILLQARKARRTEGKGVSMKQVGLVIIGVLLSLPKTAVAGEGAGGPGLFGQPGILITVALVAIPLLIAVLLLIVKVNRAVAIYRRRQEDRTAALLADRLLHLEGEEIDASLLKRKASLEYRLSDHELSGVRVAEDPRGIVQHPSSDTGLPFVARKRRLVKRADIDPLLSRLIIAYLASAVVWLVFGTTVGEYVGIKFVAPDVDQVSWLSFGRLRPVHTNAVFWGWSSLAMLGIAHYVVPVVGNVALNSVRKGWIALILINASVLLGTICLMAGINNGGGEYREYVWPVMALFGAGLALALVNFLQTIARRATKEIYISNWYIVSAIIFTLVIAFVAYWPTWQDGLGETIVQGYYMHQGVGMWFMLFTLGIVYYFLPEQLNKPIYSYSLGILAFWTQILFYTLIGTHHFVFSSIPWWLQTVAIVGSMGMVIPVIAGTTNFAMTLRGNSSRIAGSYTLPFFAVGIVFYFTGSLQGTAEAFRYTNLIWHFTDFTVAHSHLTMYGIIAFILWGSIYALIPRLTGREPSHLLVGTHFWLAFVGLLLYSVPLMIGGTLKGLSWMEGRPFLESVTLMAPYWLWRAIGGSMMWLSHLFFAWNVYRMVAGNREVDVRRLAFEKIAQASRKDPELLTVN